MKKSIYLLSLIFVTQFFVTSLFAQEQQTLEKASSKNTFTLNLSRLILNEARFGLERQITERQSFRASLGIKYPTKSESFGIILFYPYHFPVSKGSYLGVGYNFVLGVKSRIYISPEIYYNYNYYDDKFYNHPSGQDDKSYTNLQSMQLHKTGIKVVFGKKVDIFSNEKMSLKLDFYAGFGMQYREEETTVSAYYSGGITDDYSQLTKKETPTTDISKEWYPTLNIGVLMGISFKK